MKTLFLSIASIFTLIGTVVAGPDQPVVEGKNPCHDSKWDCHRPDSHAPIGVMGDHTHKQGEFMMSYRYMFMEMRPNYIGTDQVGLAQIQGPPQRTHLPDHSDRYANPDAHAGTHVCSQR